MLRLDIEYSDGSHSHAWGGVDWIEQAIAQSAETGKEVAQWAVTGSE